MGLAFVAILLADAANYNPSTYLQQDAFESGSGSGSGSTSARVDDALKDAEVMLNGVRYRKFSSSFGAILVPDVTEVNRDSLERSLCDNPAEECAPSDTACIKRNAERHGAATVVRAEARLSNDAKLYAQLISDTIAN